MYCYGWKSAQGTTLGSELVAPTASAPRERSRSRLQLYLTSVHPQNARRTGAAQPADERAAVGVAVDGLRPGASVLEGVLDALRSVLEVGLHLVGLALALQ